VLVPNLQGAEAAIDSGAHGMLLPLSVSHAHSLANLRKTPDEVVAHLRASVPRATRRGSRMILEIGMSTAFGCTLQGPVESEVLRLVQAVLDAGCDRVGLADTVGYADPRGAAPVHQGPRHCRRPALVRPFPRHPRPGPGQCVRGAADRRDPFRRLPGRHRRLPACTRAPAATWPPKTWSICCAAWASTPASISSALLALRRAPGRWLAGEPLHGAIAQAGLPRTLHPWRPPG
jgi:hydroxymethylglutaryl-CoA lyase